MTHTPNPIDDVFANEDISELISKAGIDARDLELHTTSHGPLDASVGAPGQPAADRRAV